MAVQQHRTLREPRSVIFAGVGWLLGCASAPQAATLPSPAQSPRDIASGSSSAVLGDVLGPAPVARHDHRREVAFSLHAHMTSLQRGSTLWLAARFELPPGAHIYWTNPGESGLATTVRFLAPSSLAVGAPRFPGPRRFASVGGSVGYGYAGKLVVLAPATLTGNVDEVTISAEASWLSCDVVCVKRSGYSSLRVNAGNTAQLAELPRWLSALPQPVDDEVSEVEWLGPDTFRVTTRAGVTPFEFFPAAPLGPDDRDCVHSARPESRALDVQLRAAHVSRPMHGVLSLQDSRGVRFVELSIPGAPPRQRRQ